MSDPDLTILPASALADLKVDSGGTITRSKLCVAETLAAHSATLQTHAISGAQGLQLGAVIGRGGMGVVRLATQAALKRTVAVKQVSRQTDSVVSALLREAWIAGSLEHPNILPIHALAEGEAGPMLVMKRIEGVPWSTVLRDPDQAPGGRPQEDLLTWHLRIFMRVCHAVHFAHSRGLLHLDIKPANVMLGAFDEVYLLDWGLSASVNDAAPDWMPQTRAIDGTLGTPGYMAPEMAVGNGAWIDARTDVYLLGAVLHELMTGRLLHAGDLNAAVAHAFAAKPPELSPDIPRELAQICLKAVARHRDDRFEGVDALRRAVDAFLQHRHATALTEKAMARLATLDTEGVDQHRVIAEGRFGLRMALEAWPDQPVARAGLTRLLKNLAEQQLSRGEFAAARESVLEMPEPDSVLLAEIETARSARLAEDAQIAQALRDQDLNVHTTLRTRWVFAIGMAWLLANLAYGWVFRSGWLTLSYTHLFLMSAMACSLYLLGYRSVRDTLMTVAVDRKVVHVIGTTQISVPFFWLGCAALGLPPLSAVGLSLPLYFFFMIMVAATIDARVIWMALALAPCAICAPIWPRYAFEFAGVAGFASAVPPAWVWARAARRGRLAV